MGLCIPQPKTCCSVFSLKSGNLLLGCLNAVVSLTLITLSLLTACIISPLMPCSLWTAPHGNDQGMGALAGLVLIFLAIMIFVKFCCDVFFVYGVVKERAGIVDTYFYFNFVVLMLSELLFILCGFSSIGTLCIEMVYTGLNICTIIFADAFYKHLKRCEQTRNV